MQLGTGLTFENDEQLLVSVQKPLGVLLEEARHGCLVADLAVGGSAARAGVRVGDQLLAVNNLDVRAAGLDAVMGRLASAPRVVNLRFARSFRSRPASMLESAEPVVRGAQRGGCTARAAAPSAVLLAASISSRSTPDRSAAWLDALLGDEGLVAARWDAATAGILEVERSTSACYDDALTYGEFPAAPFAELVESAVSARRADGDASSLTFCDIGSGGGRLVLSAAAGRHWKACVGVELLEPLHEVACQLHTAALELAARLGVPLSPCRFARLDVENAEAAAEALREVDVAFAFATCFDDARAASALRRALPVGALVVTIDALMPNVEHEGGADLPFFALLESGPVGVAIGDGEQSGHTAHLWELRAERPERSIDYAVLVPAGTH